MKYTDAKWQSKQYALEEWQKVLSTEETDTNIWSNPAEMRVVEWEGSQVTVENE